MASVIRGSDNFDSLIHQGLGVNQTWQDVKASRSVGVTYTNTTGKPISVSVEMYGSISADLTLYINGSLISTQSSIAGQTNTVLNYIIPNGSLYRFVAGNTITSWYELR